jgi:hypothetical protein
MAQVLQSTLVVGPLAPGLSIGVNHGLLAPGPVTPNLIWPTTGTGIVVTNYNSTFIIFSNTGPATATATFIVQRWQTPQAAASDTTALVWRGPGSAQALRLTTPQWDDMRVPVTSTVAYGSDPPTFSLFKDTGAAPAGGSAVLFNGTSSTGTMADFGDTGLSWSFCCWFKSTYVGAQARCLLFKNAAVEISIAAGKIRVILQGLPTINSTLPFLVGGRNFLVVTITAGTIVDIYLNNVLSDSIALGALAADNANAWYVGSTNAPNRYFPGTIDELRIYQAVLSVVDIAFLWALGVGTENEPVVGPVLLAGYHFNEGAGNTADNYEGTAARDMTLTDPAWVAAIIMAPFSRGVFLWAFGADTDQELFFTAQLPHGYVEGTDLHVHVHWVPSDATAGNVTWSLEYLMTTEGVVVGGTSIISATGAATGAAPKHILTDIGVIAGAALKISSMVVGRIARLGTAGTDTYPNPAFLLEIDFHFQVNTLGSTSEFAK